MRILTAMSTKTLGSDTNAARSEGGEKSTLRSRCRSLEILNQENTKCFCKNIKSHV